MFVSHLDQAERRSPCHGAHRHDVLLEELEALEASPQAFPQGARVHGLPLLTSTQSKQTKYDSKDAPIALSCNQSGTS